MALITRFISHARSHEAACVRVVRVGDMKGAGRRSDHSYHFIISHRRTWINKSHLTDRDTNARTCFVGRGGGGVRVLEALVAVARALPGILLSSRPAAAQQAKPQHHAIDCQACMVWV